VERMLYGKSSRRPKPPHYSRTSASAAAKATAAAEAAAAKGEGGRKGGPEREGGLVAAVRLADEAAERGEHTRAMALYDAALRDRYVYVRILLSIP